MTTYSRTHQEDHLTSAITLYLKAHPNAADSVEGIMQWWLPQQHRPVDVNELQSVLDHLVGSGMLARTPLLDGRMLYTSRVRDKRLKLV